MTLNLVLQVTVVVDDSSCNNNDDINFHFTGFVLVYAFASFFFFQLCNWWFGHLSSFKIFMLYSFVYCSFTLSGKVLGAVGGESCLIKNGGPADVNVELLSSDGSEDPVASVLTSSDGSYLFKNIIPGTYNIRASHPELQVEVRGSTEVSDLFDFAFNFYFTFFV